MNRIFPNTTPPQSRLSMAVGRACRQYVTGGHAELVALSDRQIAQANAIAEVSEAMSRAKVEAVKPLVLAGEYDADDAIDGAVGALLPHVVPQEDTTLVTRMRDAMDAERAEELARAEWDRKNVADRYE